MSFQFTSPNAAGAQDNQAMLAALRESLKEVQKVEANTIELAPKIAAIEGDAIKHQAEQESAQMKSQGIGSIASGVAVMSTAVSEGINIRQSAPADHLLSEADLNDSYANALEDGAPTDPATAVHLHVEDGNTTAQTPGDVEEAPNQRQNQQELSINAKKTVREQFETHAENRNLKSSARERQTSANNESDAIQMDKNQLRDLSSQMTKEHRAELVSRFRARAASQRANAQHIDAASQRLSNRNQAIGQFGSSAAQGFGNTYASAKKITAGEEQYEAEMARQLAQARSKTQDTARSQVQGATDSLKSATDSMRNYYSSRG